MRRRAAKIAASLCAALALCAFAAYELWALGLDHLAPVRAGEAYRSGAMPPGKLLATVRALGIRTVVDLRRNREDASAERALLAQVGVRHVHVPSKQVPDAQTIDAFLAVVSRPENRPVLFHCNHGVGRAPLFEALYRIELLGWEPESARRSARWRSGLGDFAPEDAKGSFLRRYTPRRQPDVASAPPR